MKSFKEWYTSKQLEGLKGLPNQATNITRKARKENWKARDIKGVKGGGLEFHYSSFPDEVLKQLGIEANSTREPVALYNIERRVNNEDLTEVSKARFLTAISTLEEILAMTRKTMAPEAKAQMVWMIYELLSEESANEKIINLVKLVA